MSKFSKWLFGIYCGITVLSVCAIVFYLVINFGFEKPKVSNYEYFSSITVPSDIESDDISPSDEIPIIEMNICRSETNQDLNLTEMVFTEYTDYAHTSYKRYAMQVVGNFGYWSPEGKELSVRYDVPHSVIRSASSSSEVYLNDLWSDGVYFYEIDSVGNVTNLDYNSFESYFNDLDVIAGENNFKLELGGNKGTYTYTRVEEYNGGLFNLLVKTRDVTRTNEFNVYDLFWNLACRFDIDEPNCTKYFNNMDLDKFFTITKGNDRNQYYTIEDVTTNNAYFTVRSTHTNITNSLTTSNSIIGVIKSDANYTSGVVNTKKNYYSTGVNLTLSNLDFEVVYKSIINKYVLTLKSTYQDYLLSLNNLTIDIDIDLDDFDFDYVVSGIDLGSFKRLEVSNLKIHSSSSLDFYMLNTNRKISTYDISNTLSLKTINGGVWSNE